MGLWAPFMTRTMPHEVNGPYGTLGPYAAAIFLTLGALLSCFIWNIYFMKHPLVGEPVSFGGFFRAPGSGHALGVLGGFIWGTGMVFNLVAAASPASRSRTLSGNPRPWSPRSGECLPGRNSPARRAKRSYTYF